MERIDSLNLTNVKCYFRVHQKLVMPGPRKEYHQLLWPLCNWFGHSIKVCFTVDRTPSIHGATNRTVCLRSYCSFVKRADLRKSTLFFAIQLNCFLSVITGFTCPRCIYLFKTGRCGLWLPSDTSDSVGPNRYESAVTSLRL